VYTLNEEIKEENWVRCNAEKCYVYETDEVEKIIDNSVTFTGVLMYFNEPIDEEKVFSERFCDWFEIKKEDNFYVVNFPGGSENRYYYKNGVCNRLKVSSMFADIDFKLRD
jgi:hypothetical protein